jgi:hypothetical protein
VANSGLSQPGERPAPPDSPNFARKIRLHLSDIGQRAVMNIAKLNTEIMLTRR